MKISNYQLPITNYRLLFITLLITASFMMPLSSFSAEHGSEKEFVNSSLAQGTTDQGQRTPPTSDQGQRTPPRGQETIQIPNPLGVRTFGELADRIVNWLLVIATPILALMIVIGAFQMMTGAGQPEKIKMGKTTITWAIVGYALLLVSKGITFIIQELLRVR